MVNDNVLRMVACMERAVDAANPEKRVQLNKVELQSIQRTIEMVLDQMKAADVLRCDSMLVSDLLQLQETLRSLGEIADFFQTDVETKAAIVNKLYSCKQRAYKLAGEFYMTNEFNYNPRLKQLLSRIVEGNVSQGFTFGFTE